MTLTTLPATPQNPQISKPWKPTLPPARKYKKAIFEDVVKTGSFIYQIGESPILRERSTEIPLEKLHTEEYQAKIKYLKNCMLKYRKLTGVGRGITAVQIGIPERFSVIYDPFKSEKEKERLEIIINPVITRKSTRLLKYPEQCISANPIIAPVIRPSWIEFDYFDEQGNSRHWDRQDETLADLIMNRIFQHEFDHMDGIICIDLVQPPDKLTFEPNLPTGKRTPTLYKTAKFEEIK
ncbi:MAG: hypothetical protein C4584_02675 [Armatimonadetes bacterium]|nr:MAG: hypothetical protein C4584_02675 [Armatimonadota bacterium]